MGLTQTIIIIVVIIFAFSYFMPEEFNSLKDSILSKSKEPAVQKVKEDAKENVDSLIDTIDEYVDENIINDTEDEILTEEQEVIASEICERTYSDYPDYYGTTKWGQDCNDAATPDLECMTYAPTRYTGSIDLDAETSNPSINCCIPDGKCYWS